MSKVLILICLLGQSHDDCKAKPYDQVFVSDCSGMNDCYLRAMDVASRLTDDKSYPMIRFGNDVEDVPRSSSSK
jgi:hypothetical protein